jgi:hypothetical protein
VCFPSFGASARRLSSTASISLLFEAFVRSACLVVGVAAWWAEGDRRNGQNHQCEVEGVRLEYPQTPQSYMDTLQSYPNLRNLKGISWNGPQSLFN